PQGRRRHGAGHRKAGPTAPVGRRLVQGRRRMSAYQGRFTGRTAVVTGGASGLGKASAARIVAEGGKVVLWDLNPETLKAAAEEVGATAVVALDVSDAAAVEAAARTSHDALGRIDILIASAGITGATVPVQEFPLDSW